MAITVIWKAVDAAWALYSLIFAVAAPLFVSQVVLPLDLYAAPLVSFQRRFVDKNDHYLMADPPPFFRGLIWLALAFFWPVAVANLYAVATRRRRWIAATSLMGGVCMLTYLSTMYGDMLGSGRETQKLIRFYVPYVFLSVAMVLRGLCSFLDLPADTTTTAGLVEASAHKKRA